jgi:hypothetical protein
MLEFEAGSFDFLDALEALELEAIDSLFLALDSIGRETIEYLKSETDEVRPPAYSGGPERQAHPGHWADVTGDLKRGYRYTVDRRRTANPTLKLENRSGHAAILEERDGFFVLSEVMDKGGPVERAMKRAVHRFFPGSTIVEGL